MQDGEKTQVTEEIILEAEKDKIVSEIKAGIMDAPDNKTATEHGHSAIELFTRGLIQQDEFSEIFSILKDKVIKKCDEIREMLNQKMLTTPPDEMRQLIKFHYQNQNIPDTDARSMLTRLDQMS